MIKKSTYFLVWLVISISPTILAQQHKQIDSLKYVEKQQTGISQINTLEELSWQLRKTNDSSGIRYALKALKLSKEQLYYKGISDAYNRLGGIAKHQKKYKHAKEYYEKALAVDLKQDYGYGIARGYNQLGLIYKKQKNFVSAINAFENALITFKKINDDKHCAKTAINLGTLYLHYNKNKDCLAYYLDALAFSKKCNNTILIAKSLKSLGTAQKKSHNYKEALHYLKEALEVYKTNNNLKEIGKTQILIAGIYSLLQEYDLSKKTYLQTIRLVEKNDHIDRGALYSNFAMLYLKLQQPDSALYYYQKSIKVHTAQNNNKNLLVTYNNLGNLYFYNKQYKKSIAVLQKSLDLQRSVKDSSTLALTYSSLAKTHYTLKNYQLAYQYKDSSFLVAQHQSSKIKSADRYEVAYLNEKKKAEAAISSEKIAVAEKDRKNSLITALFLLLLLLIILFFYAIVVKKKKQQKLLFALEKQQQDQQIQTLISTQEMQAFDAMITGEEKERKRIAEDLHDNFSSKLALIKVLFQSIGDNLPKEATTNYAKANILLDEACNEIRTISHKMLSGTLANFGLVPALKELQNTIENVYTKQHKKQIQISVSFHKLDIRLEYVIEIQIYRVIQELLTNIIKHANATQVDIQLLKLSNAVNIVVEDNGIGFDPKNLNKGVGLKNIHSRIVNKLKGKYNIDSNKGNGTTITIDIPIENTNTYEK